MPTQKKRTRRKPTGRLIDVARVVSVGEDRQLAADSVRLPHRNCVTALKGRAIE